ncbi:uncharacterized protein [Macrobrachium rosenbergii]|uniref:uncharacterized protein n=1 Tax=Macrobrachium rosenbergii TaxID=79674 RepID=UPI0034D496E9
MVEDVHLYLEIFLVHHTAWKEGIWSKGHQALPSLKVQYSSHLLDHSFSDVSDLESCDSRNFESYSGRERHGKDTQHSEPAGGHKRSDFKHRDYEEALPFNKGHRQPSPVLNKKNLLRSFSTFGRSNSRSLSPPQNTRSYMRSVSFPTADSCSRVHNITSSSKNSRLSNRRSYSRSPSPGKKFYSSASQSRSPPREKSPETLALMSLRDVHNKECGVYRKNPKAHPDHEKEFRIYRDKKMQCIIGLGGDPNTYDVTKDWEAHWPHRLEQLLELSWISKRDKCLEVLKQSRLSRNRTPLLGLQQRMEFNRKVNRSRSRSSSRESERQIKDFSRKLKRNRSVSRSYSPESNILSCKKNSFITKEKRNRSRSRSVSWESERRSASRESERLLQKEKEYIRKLDRKRSRSRSSSVESKAQSEGWKEFMAEQEEKRSRSRSSSRKSERFSQKQKDHVTMSKRKRSRSSSEESEGQSDDKGEFSVKQNSDISKHGSSREREIIQKRLDTSNLGKRSDDDHSCEGDRSTTFGKDKTESLPGLSCFLEKHSRDKTTRNQDRAEVNFDVKEDELRRLKTILSDEQIHTLLKLSKEIPLDDVGKSSLSGAANKEFIVGSQSMRRGSGDEIAGGRIISKIENSVKGSDLIFPPKIDTASLEHHISQIHPFQASKSGLFAEVLEKIEARNLSIKSDIGTSKVSSSSRSVLPSANEEESANEVTSTTPSFGTGTQEDIMEVLEILMRLGDRLNVLKMPLKVLYDKALLYKSVGSEATKVLHDKDSKTLLHLISSKLSKLMEEENMTIVQRVIIQEANERLCNILKALDPDLEISLIAEKCLGKNETDTIAYIQSQFLENGLYSGSHEQLKAVYAAVQSEKSKLLNQILKQSNTSLNSPSSNSIMNTFHIQNKEMSAKHEVSSYSPFQHSWFSDDSQGSRSVGNPSSLLGDNIKKETATYSKLSSEYKLEFPPKLQLEGILPKRQAKNSCVQKKCEDFTFQWECEDSPPRGASDKYLSKDNIEKHFRKTHISPRLEFEGLRKQLRDSQFEADCDKFSSQRFSKEVPSSISLDFPVERQRESGRSVTGFDFSSLQEGDEFPTKIELDFPSKRRLKDSPTREFGKFSSKGLFEDILSGRAHERLSSKQEEKFPVWYAV